VKIFGACYLNNDIFKLNTCSTIIFKNNDVRVEKPYDTRICRNMIITLATLSNFLDIWYEKFRHMVMKIILQMTIVFAEAELYRLKHSN
jgi:hypothetical protein